jgi:hypothetical protein
MTISEIKKKAQQVGIKPGKMTKTELIHAIQKGENYSPCYGTLNGHCPYTNCCWMSDCLKVKSYVTA